MSNISKLLQRLSEAEWHPSEDEIEAYAEKHDLSWGKAEDALIKAHKKEQSAAARNPYGPKPKMTRAQYEKRCRDAWKDWKGDNPDYDDNNEDVFYDLAAGLLYDPEFKAYCQYEFGKAQNRQVSNQIVKEIVADQIASNRR